MIKLVVCITIVVCCCLLGYIKAASYKGRCIELQNVLEMIKLLHIEMTYRKDSLAKSFKRISETKNCWFSDVLDECSNNLMCGYSLSDSWRTSVNGLRNKSPLNNKDIEILDDIVVGLGKSDSEGQKKIFEPAEMRLQTNLKNALIQEQKLGRMYISLGTAAGVIAVILLI